MEINKKDLLLGLLTKESLEDVEEEVWYLFSAYSPSLFSGEFLDREDKIDVCTYYNVNKVRDIILLLAKD